MFYTKLVEKNKKYNIMKQLDFTKGIITESQQINEFLGGILVAAALGMLVTKGSLNMLNSISELRQSIMSHRKQRLADKQEVEKYKAEEKLQKLNKKWMKEQEKFMKKQMKYSCAWNTAIQSMPEGKDKDNMLKQFEDNKKVLQGKATENDRKALQQYIDNAPKEANDIQDKVARNVDKADLEEQTQQFCKDNKIDPNPKKQLETITKSVENEISKETETKTEPEEFTDTDGNTYKKDETGKCTMTDAEGTTTDITPEDFDSKKKANDENEDDEKQGDVRIDKDDDLEDEKFDTGNGKAKLSDKQDPRKVFKQRTYKRGDKTFRTKNYYSKRGVSISKDEFRDRVANWEKKNKKNPQTKNESFIKSPWTVTRLCKFKQSTNITEDKHSSDMESICKSRLAYIKYTIDNTHNDDEKSKLESMYNAIYNCCFDVNGKVRTMEDLYKYLDNVMIENEGKIPGLPDNDQITNIDDKCDAWKKLSPDEFDKYVTQIDKNNLDKQGTKKTDNAKDIISPENTKTDTEALDKIKGISSIYGFTNILGLEPTRKASSDDETKKDEVKKQQKDGSPTADATDSKNVDPKDISPEQINKIIGATK